MKNPKTETKIPKTSALTADQQRLFLENGFIKVPNAIPKAVVDEWLSSVWTRAGVDINRRKTWPRGGKFLDFTRTGLIKDLAPDLWALICDLVGGEDRIDQPEKHTISDSFLLNFPLTKAERAKVEGTEEAKKMAHLKTWHKDFDQTQKHFLDSREAGLLAFVLWTPTDGEGQGATEMALDSIAGMAKVLRDAPEGLMTKEMPISDIGDQGRHEVALGDSGTVYLVHPYMIHRSAWNISDKPRVMTNRTIALKELCFDRPASEGYSPVELAVLQGLGVKRLKFRRAVLA